MTFKRFMLSLVFIMGVALGWGARGANDGNRVEAEVKVEVEKAEAVERARWEKQVRDLDMANANLQDKLAVASAKDAIIATKQKEIEELRAKVATADKPATTPPTEPVKPSDAKPAESKAVDPKSLPVQRMPDLPPKPQA